MADGRSIFRLGALALVLASCIEVTVDAPPAPRETPELDAKKAAPAVAPEQKAAPATPAAPAVATTKATFTVREPIAPAPASLEVVDAGTEPRSIVALSAKPGDRVAARVGLALQVAMKVGDNEVPKTTLPRIDVDVVGEVARVDDARIEIALSVAGVRMDEAADVTARVREALRRTAEALRTTTGTLVLGKDGRVQSIVMTGQADAIESRAAGLDHALVELLPAWPSTPIGVGARWRVVQPVVRGGVTLQRTSELRLLGRDGDRLELEIETTHVAVRGGDNGGGSTRIEAQSGEGRGRIVAASDRVLPVEGEIHSTTTTRASFGGAASGVLVEIDLALFLAAADTVH